MNASSRMDTGLRGGRCIALVDGRYMAWLLGQNPEATGEPLNRHALAPVLSALLAQWGVQKGHMFADFDAGDIGFDGLEFATDVGRGIRFHIKHVLMAGSAREEHHDDGFVVAFDSGACFGCQQLRQRHAAERETANGQKVAPA